MIPKEIIKLAVAGGWKGWWDNSLGPVKIIDNHSNAVGWEIVALDCTFWQALGKSCGWYCLHCGGSGIAPNRDKCFGCGGKGTTSDRWRKNALIFYDLVLTKGDTSKFWTELLTPPTN